MLRGLDVHSQWRSLAPGFWPNNVPLGKRTIVYGHNGSGKSTIAELLLALDSDGAPVDTYWEDEGGNRNRIRRGALAPARGIAVFTKRWVEENLSAFLDGQSASAIVTLGKEAISAREEEERLAGEIVALTRSAKEHTSRAREHAKKAEGLAREVQSLIVSELEEVDRRRFTKHRYQLPAVKADLAGFVGNPPSAAEHAAALMRLGEGAPEKVAVIRPMPDEVTAALDGLDVLLGETPTREALTSLQNNPEAQRWVEEGRVLHEDETECFFCASHLTALRRDALARHFDESWMKIRARARLIREQVQAEAKDLTAWATEWPDSLLITGELRTTYQRAVEAIRKAIATRVGVLESIAKVLAAKEQDPSATPASPDRTPLRATPSIAIAEQLVEKHNELADDHERLRAASIATRDRPAMARHRIVAGEAAANGSPGLEGSPGLAHRCARGID